MPSIRAEVVPHALAPAGLLVQFFILAMASLQERRLRTNAWRYFAAFDHNDDVLSPRIPEGIFHHDARHLSATQL
ncbi:hypothetical protein [Bosea sp. BK604]|uniref:hypothetical protein n=1 Tax=Bosea sp. BK604 TaxID=2512180 RepID=UPI00104447FB|nr:hypothetical protein [Bosea sp. BK604]